MCMILVSHHQDVFGFSRTAHVFPDFEDDVGGAQILEGTPVFADIRGDRAKVIGWYGRPNAFSHLPLGKNWTSSLLEDLDDDLRQSLVDRTGGGRPALEQPVSKRKRDNSVPLRELACWNTPNQQLLGDESSQPGRLPSVAEFAFQVHDQVTTERLACTPSPVRPILALHFCLHTPIVLV
jgi:hypothetical protein